MKLGVALPMAGAWATLAEIREDIDRYAEADLTELFLEPNFQPGGAQLDRVLDVMAELAPRRKPSS